MSEESAREVLAEAAEACISCGLCTDQCDVLIPDDLTIGGIADAILTRTLDAEDPVVRAVARCSLCGLCCVDCPVDIDSHETMTAAREVLASQGALTYECAFTGNELSIFSEYKKKYPISYTDLCHDRCDTIYFPGCSLSSYAPELVRKVHAWLEEQGATVCVIDACCGSAFRAGGVPSGAEELREQLAEKIAATGATRLVASCPHCYAELGGALPGIEVVELASLLADAGVKVSGPEVITIHDPCPDRQARLTWKNHRRILSEHPSVEMAHAGAHTICCGSGGLVGYVDPELCESRAQARIGEFETTGAECLVTACASCAQLLSAHAPSGKVRHYLELVFGVRVDWDEVERRLEALGEDGETAETSGA